MKYVALKDIIVPENRQRREFSEKRLEELRTSISQIGLLQPIVLRSDAKTLLAGERRFRAISGLGSQSYMHEGLPVPEGHVPYVLAGELTDLELFQAELEENVIRVDLSWQEKTRAIATLYELRTKQQGKAPTFKEVATEIRGSEARGSQIDEVSNAVMLAEFLDDPLVSAARTPQEARKLMREELKSRERQKRLSTLDLSSSPHRLFNEDSLESNLEQRFANQFDVILTDPPYGIDIHKKEMFDVHSHEYDDSDDYFTNSLLAKLPSVSFAIAKPNAHIYVFGDIRRFNDLFVAFELAGWTCWPRPLIWDKGNTGSYGNIEYGFRACYDIILFARKGDRKTTAGYRDVIPIAQPTNLPHPAGKPVALYTDILRRSVLPGDHVADLFCGHGPIFQAATDLKCFAYGWEVSPKYHALAQESLAKASGIKETKNV